MSAPKWTYTWINIDHHLKAFVRYRLEETLDGFEKPYTEILAYVREIEETGSWSWHAYRHVGDQVEEMDITSSLSFLVQNKVEKILMPVDG